MEIPVPITSLLRAFGELGYRAYLVGGCVRDLLRGVTPHDWDSATDALPQQIMAHFDALPTGLQHGTVTLLWQGDPFEVTTFRTEGQYGDHRRPDTVLFTTDLHADLSRRDLTVNAMALSVDGTLIDPFGGKSDLEHHLLRCVGNAGARFSEDALRILRALRLASVLGFSVVPDTEAMLREKKEDLRYIAAERVFSELTRLLCGGHVTQILLDYPDVLGIVLPEILPCVGFDQRNPHHCYDVWGHIARSVGFAPPTETLRWTMLLHDIGKPAVFSVDEKGVGHFYGHGGVSTELARQVAQRLRFPGALRRQVEALVTYHDRSFPLTEKGLRRCLNRLGEHGARDLICVKRADNLAQHSAYRSRQAELDTAAQMITDILAKQQCFSLRQLAVNGHDMLALGYTGSEIGSVLDALLQRVLDGKMPNERKELLYEATKLQSSSR